MFEFRRGVKRCVTIYSLSFSNDSLLLACCSNTETIHIFKLETASNRLYSNAPVTNGQRALPNSSQNFNDSANSQTWMGYFGQAIMDSASYLPSNVGEMFTQGRAAFQARIPSFNEDSTFFNTCALAWINKILRLVVASTSGQLYIFNVDLSDSTGECALIRQHKIDGSTGLGVGGSRKLSTPNGSKASTGSSVAAKSNPQRVPGMSARTSSQSSGDYPHQNNVVTSEEQNSPRTSGGIDIPRSNSIEANQDLNYLPGVTHLSFPYTAGEGSFGNNQVHTASSPGSATGVSYAGALGTSPGAVEETANQFQAAIRLDDDSEFPPMTMHTDDWTAKLLNNISSKAKWFFERLDWILESKETSRTYCHCIA